MLTYENDTPRMPSPAAAHPVGEAAPETVPWEQPGRNWLVRWWETCLMGMLRPRALFAALRSGGRLEPAIGFLAVGVLVQAILAPIIAIPFDDSIAGYLLKAVPPLPGLEALSRDGDLADVWSLLPDGTGGAKQPASRRPKPATRDMMPALVPDLGIWLTVASSVFAALLAFVAFFSAAVVFQGGAVLFVPTRRSFSDTLRTIAYAHAPIVWTVLPFAGELIFTIWLSVLLVLGLRIVHSTSKTRVVLALAFFPTLALLLLAGGCYVLIRQFMAAASL